MALLLAVFTRRPIVNSPKHWRALAELQSDFEMEGSLGAQKGCQSLLLPYFASRLSWQEREVSARRELDAIACEVRNGSPEAFPSAGAADGVERGGVAGCSREQVEALTDVLYSRWPSPSPCAVLVTFPSPSFPLAATPYCVLI